MVENEFPIPGPRIPIRTSKLANKPGNKAAIWIADFFGCWLAVCGLIQIAIGFASFTWNDERIGLKLFDQPVKTTTQRLEFIVLSILAASIGFCYMLWRYHWRCRLSTMLSLMVHFCVLLGLTRLMTPNHELLLVIVFSGICIYAFSFTAYWASRPKGRALQANDESG
jgi:hypothetical protein